MWYRIFCRSNRALPIEALSAHLHAHSLNFQIDFRGDDLGWTSVSLTLGVGSPVYLERYLTKDDELRNDLNSWAAYLETCDYSPNAAPLMERVIQTQQLVTLRKPIDHSDEFGIDRLCLEMCRFITLHCEGIYQIDDDGWYAADGQLLVKEY